MKDNWMKISLLVLALALVVILGLYLNGKNVIEKERLEKERIDQEMKISMDNAINSCVTDAYTELKTLQGNLKSTSLWLCTNNKALCDFKYWEGEIDKAYDKYEKEWVPQCKLGNRVFIHYEPMSVQDLLNEKK